MSHITNVLGKHKLRIKKRLGQNFLQDPHALQFIADSAGINHQDPVLEIGAGIGNLSIYLAEKTGSFFALEKDLTLKPALSAALKSFTNTKIIFKDILKFKLPDIYSGKKLKIIGNLPYYITTPVIINLIEQKQYINLILITVQKEVAQRIIASPGKKDYGRLSCLLQYHTQPEILKIFPKHLFFPKPKVDSALVKLKILDSPSVKVKNEEMFFRVIQAIFSHRRKTLLNSLLTGSLQLNKDQLINILDSVNISPSIRGEKLSLSEIGKISDKISD
ncbi:MAG: 16S rRNA (adenine(1518)-N(6)/adenine(1519)-N(6))-dimethyltransferase RsmA [Candidatus Omnitrophota bacterium]